MWVRRFGVPADIVTARRERERTSCATRPPDRCRPLRRMRSMRHACPRATLRDPRKHCHGPARRTSGAPRRTRNESAQRHPGPGSRSDRNPRMDRIPAEGDRCRRDRPRALPVAAHGRRDAPSRRPPAVRADDGLRQHDPAGARGAHAGRRQHGMAHPLHDPLERDGDGRARQPQAWRARRAHREFRVECDAVRRRLQPLLARAVGQPSGRSDLPSGPFEPRHLRALVPGRTHCRGPARPVPHGGCRPRTGIVFVSASVADAGLLAGADGVDGPGAVAGDLPGALHEVSGAPRHDRAERPQGLVLHGRRRVRRARIARRHFAGGSRGTRQPDLRDQLQPAAPRRPGARQRQDHPGTGGRVPRCRLERDQDDLGQLLGSAARA